MKRYAVVAALFVVVVLVAVSRTGWAAEKLMKLTVEQKLKKFDDLDFDAFTNQKWERFHETHTDDVTVVWPDGHETHGFDKHIEDMKFMFSYAPDTRIKAHPVKVGGGDYTGVIGVMEGTFSKPMVMGDKTIPPTGKAFKIHMATIAHWKGDKFDKEYLFWDNADYMKQIGLGN